MGAASTGYPLIPSGYVAGTITLADSNPHQLYGLILAQLDANCPGVGYEVNIQADGSGAVYIGRASILGGPLSTTNYGYVLNPGQSRTYRGTFPGANSSVGDLEVLMTGGGTLHVEVK